MGEIILSNYLDYRFTCICEVLRLSCYVEFAIMGSRSFTALEASPVHGLCQSDRQLIGNMAYGEDETFIENEACAIYGP